MMRRALPSLIRDRSGTAAAEMVLVIPLLVALLFGGFEAGAYFWTEHKVIKGVREGARYAGRQSFAIFDCTSGTITDPVTETNIQNLTRTGYLNADNPNRPGTDNPTVASWANSDVTIVVDCDATTNQGLYTSIAGGAPRVLVSTTVSYPSLFSSLGFNTASLTVRAEAQAAVMGI